MRKVMYYYLCVWFSRESEPIGYIYIYTYVYIHICVCVCVCVCWGVGGFPGGSAGKESAFNVRDLDSILGLGKSRILKNSLDCIVHGVTKSQTWLNDFHFTFICVFVC